MLGSLFAFTTLALTVVAAPNRPDPISVVYTFTDGAYPENIAVRPNGDILINSLTHGRIYSIDPTAPTPQASVLVEFDPDVADGLLGITEYARDTFAVTAARIDLTTISTEDAAIWSIDLRGRRKGNNTQVIPHKIADLTEAGVPNGLTTLGNGILLSADSQLGVIWSTDMRTGASRIVADTDELKPLDPDGLFPGVNGVQASRDGSTLYFSNSNNGLVSRVRVGRDGSFVGNITTVAEVPAGQIGADDFIIGKDGKIWVTRAPHAVSTVLPDGRVVVLDGMSNAANPGTGNPTAVAFGRGSKQQEKILYVSSSWGVVYAIDTSRV